MEWGIIGAGLIGAKRASSLSSLGEKVAAVADVAPERASLLAKDYGCTHFSDWKKVTRDKSIGAICVATTHDALSAISVDALLHGKHVLVEKPGGRNPEEVKEIADAERKSGMKVCVGFNHRFHPAISKARQVVESGKHGKFLYMRGRYGHGGRPGYDKEWRFNPEISGGGQLIDQGSHLIDLSRFITGEKFSLAFSDLRNYYWHAKSEDTATVLLEANGGGTCLLQTSCVQWKNLFSLEIFLERAQVNVDGLGKSYGTETLTIHRMRPEMGPPETVVEKFEGDDGSFRAETEDFIRWIGGKRGMCAGTADALASISIVAEAYARKGK
jgi:predicted dehydrogenase